MKRKVFSFGASRFCKRAFSLFFILALFSSQLLWAQTYKYLRLNITGASNLHLQEVEYVVGTVTHPTVDMTSNTSTNYIASSAKAGTGAYMAFDGTDNKIYVGASTPYEVTLEFVNTTVFPNSVKIKKPGWSSLTAFTIEGSSNGTSWTTLLTISNPANWDGVQEFVLSVPDNQAPTAPSNLQASNITQTGCSLSWTASTDNVGVTGYDVYQNGSKIATVSTTSYTVSGLTAGTSYSFYVKAKDAAGNISAAGNTVSATTLSDGYRYLRVNIASGNNLHFQEFDWYVGSTIYPSSALTSNSSGGVVVSDSRSNSYAYQIYDNSTTTKVYLNTFPYSNTIDFGATKINPTAVAIAKQSYSTISSFSCEGSNDGSNWNLLYQNTASSGSWTSQTFTFGSTPPPVDTQAPTAPSNLQASGITQTGCSLSWTASTDNVGVTGYDVYQNGSLITTVTSTSYAPGGLTAGTTYSFYVKAKDAAGNISSASNTISVTTQSIVLDDKKVASINLHWANDYMTPIFADAMITRREWMDLANVNPVSVDANGWPLSDAGVVVWHGYSHRSGTYKLSFTGQATISAEWASGLTITNVNYNSSQNLTTADLVFTQRSSALRLKFSGTSGGVKNVKLMRPIAEGASTAHSTTELVDRPMKSILSKFQVVRYMDPSETNSNPQTVWADRAVPAGYQKKSLYNPYAAANQKVGICWEYIIKISNETGTDPWINVPAMVDDDYVTKLAKVFKYGSDGVNPYSSVQSTPAYAPLNSGRTLYVEYSNEVWNSGTAFRQHHYNLDAAKTAVINNLSHPLNFDNLVTSTDQVEAKGYDFAKRRVAWRSAEISKMFRAVYGDAAMMNSVRPLFCWQVSANGINSWGLEGLNYVQNYYMQTASKSVKYYFWGGGPAGYYSPLDDATIDNVWSSNNMDTAIWAPKSPGYDSRLCAAFGIKYVLYEGGPGFGDALGGSSTVPVGEIAWNDPRIYNEMTEHHEAYNKYGGELFCYYVLNHDYRWKFITDVDEPETYKMQAIEDLQTQNRNAVTIGKPVPGVFWGGSFDAISVGWKLNNSGQQNPTGAYKLIASAKEWISYRLLSQNGGDYTVSVNYKTAAASTLEIYAGGDKIATLSLPNTSNVIQTSQAYTFTMPAKKLYAVRLKVTGSADITIDKLNISQAAQSKAIAGDNKVQLQHLVAYPNPVSNGLLHVAISGCTGKMAVVALHDLNGRAVLQQEYAVESEASQVIGLDVSNLQQGMYLLVVKADNLLLNQKVLLK